MKVQAILQKVLDQGFEQKDIAELANTHPTNVSRIVSGRIKNPSFDLGSRLVSAARELAPEVFEDNAA